LQQLLNLCQFLLATDEARHLDGQVVARFGYQRCALVR
jgi:hypothetical protein